MPAIATLTLNPTIDAAYAVDRVRHTDKIRANAEHYDPGGGGINVARVVARLGGAARCYYLSGGATGRALDALLDLHQLACSRITIQGETRICTNVFEIESGKEYRFVPAGPTVEANEWQACLEQIGQASCTYLVASGSLPPGVPADFYARVARIAECNGFRFVLDSSGAGLQGGLAAAEKGSGVFLVKPSLAELRQISGEPLDCEEEIGAAALALVSSGRAETVAVTLGAEGALLARRQGIVRLPALSIEARSAVGAGDSFLGAMVFKLSNGCNPVEAFRYGIAAGAAAVLNPGTGLSQAADIKRFYRLVAKS
ncbi:1-phosphofructokinase family hexose kinase [Novosphingobium sp.]|uniref:1-phosphofructokinase family hexose kinase n=1 Tax=Novosphingobium sp. TaxID=1874826 RepID=UPI0025EE363B|nr:1-phosphofructokinase family hexose kinase [Novosphingobium sp.]